MIFVIRWTWASTRPSLSLANGSLMVRSRTWTIDEIDARGWPLVCDAGRQRADALHLLRVHELLLEPASVGDIAVGSEIADDPPVVVNDRRDQELREEGFAVLAGSPLHPATTRPALMVFQIRFQNSPGYFGSRGCSDCSR